MILEPGDLTADPDLPLYVIMGPLNKGFGDQLPLSRHRGGTVLNVLPAYFTAGLSSCLLGIPLATGTQCRFMELRKGLTTGFARLKPYSET